MKKVLIITYYWPPSGGAGVQRWLKFAKYLRDFGWEPVIYTPQNPGYPVLDQTLAHDIPLGIEVIKTPIWEPYGFYKRITGGKNSTNISSGLLKGKKSSGFIDDLAVWIRGNFFIPDARRFWINPSVKFLKRYLNANSIDAIVSTGPPHSMHLIALNVKKSINIPWLADFRDPWTDIDHYKELKISYLADRIHKKMELTVLNSCDALVVVSNAMKVNFQKITQSPIHLITNGYDPDDLDNNPVEIDQKFSISHIGTMPPNRNPEILWVALAELSDLIPNFRDALEIKLVGQVDHSVFAQLKQRNLLNHTVHLEYIPHNQVSSLMRRSAVLLLAINNSPNAKGILTGKFFEYLAAGRPILAIGPTTGDLAAILNETGAGEIANYDDLIRIKAIITDMYKQYCEKKLVISSSGIEKYQRKNLTSELAAILNKLTS